MLNTVELTESGTKMLGAKELHSDVWTNVPIPNVTLRITVYETRYRNADHTAQKLERYQLWEEGALIVDKWLTVASSGRFVKARMLYDNYRKDKREWLALMAEASAKGISAKEVRKFITERGRTLCE